MGMADANRRINLTAPLLSVRRHGVGGAETASTGLPLSAYKPGAATSSEPPGCTSAVPFGWEHRPGHPKSVRTRRPPPPPPHPLTIVGVVDEPPRCARDEARRSDALSRDDAASCATANCSAMGLSDAASAGAGPGSSEPRGRASGGAMMDRFLPAALAVAAGSPQNAFRKAAGPAPRTAAVALGARAAGGGARLLPAQRRVPLHHIAAYHYLPPVPPAPCSPRGKTDGDGADSDARSTAGFASRRCGLLSVRCVRSALLLSRRRAGRPFRSSGGERGSRREKKPLLPPRSRNGQQQLPRTGDDHGMISQQCWEEVYIKSLLRSGRGSLMGPAAAVASELDRTVWELYSRRRDEHAARPKASHLGLLLVLDRSNNEACGNAASPARKFSITGGDTALLLEGATAKSLPNGEKQLGRDDAAADTGGGGGYGFPLLLDDKEGVAGREVALSPQPQPLLPLPLPKSPTESWLARALPSVSTRPPTTSFLGLHVQPRKHAPLPWCSVDSSRDDHHDRQRQIRVHDLQK